MQDSKDDGVGPECSRKEPRILAQSLTVRLRLYLPSHAPQNPPPSNCWGGHRVRSQGQRRGVPTTNKLPAEITAGGGGGGPRAATTERLQSRKFNKRPPQ